MLRTVRFGVERLPLRAPFRIARGTKSEVDVVVVTITQDGVSGRGEGTPTGRYDQTPASVMAQLEQVRSAISEGVDRDELRSLLPPGTARNAIDCAMWDLEARRDPVGQPPFAGPVVSARTISIDAPEAMGAAARAVASARLIKVKLSADEPAERLRAVRAAAPQAMLIVDANESWSIETLTAMQGPLVEADVRLVEQPLASREDAALLGFKSSIPICADESCHVAADVERLRDRYDAVNIKLDKTGGLTEALDLLTAARTAGMSVMVGCMLGSSLAMAPAFHLARLADYADLDGPWWMQEDRPGGMMFEEDGGVFPPADELWTCRLA